MKLHWTAMFLHALILVVGIATSAVVMALDTTKEAHGHKAVLDDQDMDVPRVDIPQATWNTKGVNHRKDAEIHRNLWEPEGDPEGDPDGELVSGKGGKRGGKGDDCAGGGKGKGKGSGRRRRGRRFLSGKGGDGGDGDGCIGGDPVEGDPVGGDPVGGDPVEGDPVEGDPPV